MSFSINKVALLGVLGQSPEVKETANGKKYARFSIACYESWKNSEGEKQESTEWVNCIVWGDGLVGIVEKLLHKGTQVYVEGKLQTTSKENDSGTKTYYTTVNVKDFVLCKPAKKSDDDDSLPPDEFDYERPTHGQALANQSKKKRESMEQPINIEDIPFR